MWLRNRTSSKIIKEIISLSQGSSRIPTIQVNVSISSPFQGGTSEVRTSQADNPSQQSTISDSASYPNDNQQQQSATKDTRTKPKRAPKARYVPSRYMQTKPKN